MVTLLKDQEWISLETLRRTNDPMEICSPQSLPRIAKDKTYAKDLLEAWNRDYEEVDPKKDDTATTISPAMASLKTEAQQMISSRSSQDSFGCVFPYTGSEGEEYGGFLVVPQHLHQQNFEVTQKVPVVIMFHTGAGPQDIFNRYQADKLAREKIWGREGCIIFIADVVSDKVGWTWGNRERYWAKRNEILSVEERGGVMKRYKLQAILSSIMDVVRSIDIADLDRIAAIGFCFGGQSVLELSEMQFDEILGLVTFHGLFDGVTSLDFEEPRKDKEKPLSWKNKPREVLICNGQGDPYVPTCDLEGARKKFEDSGFHVTVLNFEHALHNFSNPRTKYDDPDAPFGYNEQADITSWDETLKLFQRIFQL